MAKKTETPLVKCEGCDYSQYTPTANKNDPKIVYCAALERRLVARSSRKCLSFKPIKNVD